MRNIRGFAAVIVGMCLLAIGCAPSPPPAGPPAGDLAFLPDRFERGTLFRFYRANGRSVRANNWTGGFDFTGVSWNDPRTATAISRRHVVMAAHFARSPSVPLVFHDRDGVAHRRQLTAITPLRGLGDIAVGKLDSPLPPGIAHYPLARPVDAGYKRAVLVTDQAMTVAVHRIGPQRGRTVQLGYDPAIDRRYWRNLVHGDSGNPAFIIHDGGLRLLTTFTTGGPGAGPFYGHPDIRARLLEITGS